MSKLTNRENVLQKKKNKRTHADSFASGCLGVCMRVSVGVCWSAGVSVSPSTCVDGCVYRTLHPCHGVNVLHKRSCPEDWCFSVSFGIVNCSFFYVTLSLSRAPPGCLRDVRFNGRSVPLDGEQPSEGLQVVTLQGVSSGCSSDACRRHHCSPPLICVDLWRHHECRCCQYIEYI